ncbi:MULTISPECIES: hypothetical protein [unclassified Thioalkalivibrio]|uniref:hypothetical protein n=1 Tax=unclassified Thioalkalivibrio TaxID=2621013 RepID=UPI0012DD9969|nr:MULTISPECIES: hypothetical protein [unclassified Thioalkalivibrio]
MKNNYTDLVFGQASREYLASLFDRLFCSFLRSLIQHNIGENVDELVFMLSELDRTPEGDLGVSLNRFIIARFLAPEDKPLQLRPRQYLRELRAVDSKSAANWGEMCSLSSMILEYRNSHQHQPNNNPTRTRDLLLVGAIARVHELAERLLDSDGDAPHDVPLQYSELLKTISAEGQIRPKDEYEGGGVSDKLDVPHKGAGESEDSSSDVLSILAQLHTSGCARLLDAVFGRSNTEPRYLWDSSSEFKAKIKTDVAEVLSSVELESRRALIRFFFDEDDYDGIIEDDMILQALRKLRHPSRSEKLRPLVFIPGYDD